MNRLDEYYAQVTESWMIDKVEPFADSFMRNPMVLSCGCLLYTLNHTWQVKKRRNKNKLLPYCECDEMRVRDLLKESFLRPRRTLAEHKAEIERHQTQLKISYFMALTCGCCLLVESKYSAFVTTCRGLRPTAAGCKLGRVRYRALTQASKDKFWRNVRDADVWL